MDDRLILQGWGRYPQIDAQTVSCETAHQFHEVLGSPSNVIVFGKGRSYGDSALNPRAILSTGFDKILSFDRHQGILACESGVSLAELLDVIVPAGWFFSVTPGTKYVTVGGAIASDVHGKNHHNAGCFSDWLVAFDLMLPDGQIVQCSHDHHPELFQATCGGMGLTGIILNATLKLQPIKSAAIHQRTVNARHLEEVIDQFEQYHASPYSVAWIDCLAQGASFGRSLLILGNHAEDGGLERRPKPQVSIPFALPDFCLSPLTVSLFNRFYYKAKSRSDERLTVDLDGFFYPLDAIGHWNRLYGTSGFMQYQFVIPKEAGILGLSTILHKVNTAGCGSFLAVLKLLGPKNANYLSFPLEGYTLALDFKLRPSVFALFDELDRIVVDHGGRLYLSKDARMPPDVFRKGYTEWEKFVAIRQSQGAAAKFQSLQSRRLGI